MVKSPNLLSIPVRPLALPPPVLAQGQLHRLEVRSHGLGLIEDVNPDIAIALVMRRLFE